MFLYIINVFFVFYFNGELKIETSLPKYLLSLLSTMKTKKASTIYYYKLSNYFKQTEYFTNLFFSIERNNISEIKLRENPISFQLSLIVKNNTIKNLAYSLLNKI